VGERVILRPVDEACSSSVIRRRLGGRSRDAVNRVGLAAAGDALDATETGSASRRLVVR
jgi:hypothetical protein